MSVVPLAVTWGAGGVLAALALPRLHRRRLAALVPLAAAIVALAGLPSALQPDLGAVAGVGGFELGRPAAALALLSALAVTVTLLLAPPPGSGDVAVLGGTGALSVVALGTGSPLVWAACLVAAAALSGIHWATLAPARTTLAAARVATLGAATLLAAALFLPVDTTAVAPRAHTAAALLAAGVVGGFGLVPFGGWVLGATRGLRGPALAPWALLTVPVLVLTTQPLQVVLPAASRPVLGGMLLAAGLATALWSAFHGLIGGDRDRYRRVLLLDLGLVATGLASAANTARIGSLLVLLTHLCVGPLLLQGATADHSRPRRLAWLALSGVPPSPAFWGRFALLVGVITTLGGLPLLALVPALGAALVISAMAIASAPAAADSAAAGIAARLGAWLPPLAAVAVGLVPETTLRTLFGLG